MYPVAEYHHLHHHPSIYAGERVRRAVGTSRAVGAAVMRAVAVERLTAGLAVAGPKSSMANVRTWAWNYELRICCTIQIHIHYNTTTKAFDTTHTPQTSARSR